MFKEEGNIDSCLLVKEGEKPWTARDLSVTCVSCEKSICDNVKLKRGKIYCSDCYAKTQEWCK